jgi:hypothetical protein
LLVDPRGSVHATSGVLPVQVLSIPSSHFSDALKHIGVTFQIGPLLTDAEKLCAAAPTEAGRHWTWLTKLNGSDWQETSTIAPATERAEFYASPKLVEGWLKLLPTK